MATKGYAAAEVEQTYSRAWQLCQQVYAGETSHIFPILYGRWSILFCPGSASDRLSTGARILTAGAAAARPGDYRGSPVRGLVQFVMGELVSARPHFEQIAALYNVEQHRPLIFQYRTRPWVGRPIRWALLTCGCWAMRSKRGDGAIGPFCWRARQPTRIAWPIP